MTLFLTAVPIGVFVFGYLVCWRVLRKVTSAPMLHGALIGIIARRCTWASPSRIAEDWSN